MPTVIIPPTDVSPYTGTGSQVLATNPVFPGNITVSGTGTSSVAGTLTVGSGGTGNNNGNVIANGGSGSLGGPLFSAQINGTNVLRLGSETAILGSGSTTKGVLFVQSGALDAYTNGTLALTLDSSQNATFAGNNKIGADYTVSQKKLEIIGGSYADGQTLRLADYSTAYGFDIVNDGVNGKLKIIRHENSVGGTEAMSIDRATGNATFAGKVTSSNGFIANATPTSAEFSLDTSGNSVSVSANSTIYPFSNADNFSGMVIVNDINNTGKIALYITGGGVTSLVAGDNTVWGGGVGASNYNLYVSSGKVIFQNNTGSAVSFTFGSIRTRAQQ